MLQFYFLSILLNLIAGLIFIYVMKDGDETSLVLSDSSDPLADDSAGSDFDLNLDSDSDELGSAAQKPKKFGQGGAFKDLALPFLSDKTFQLVVGILSLLTGLMKLLSPIQYDVAVVGDLIPALAGLASGGVLLLDWYQGRSEVELSLPEAIQNVYTGGRKYLGIFCVIAAVLHFIFPLVLFL